MSRRFELGQAYRSSQLTPGTTVVRRAEHWGSGDRVSTISPCCHSAHRISAVAAAYHGALDQSAAGVVVTCPGCKERWNIRLTLGDGTPIGQLPEGTSRQDLPAVLAEWTAEGQAPGRGWRKGKGKR